MVTLSKLSTVCHSVMSDRPLFVYIRVIIVTPIMIFCCPTADASNVWDMESTPWFSGDTRQDTYYIRDTININRDWLFRYDGQDDTSWQLVSLPHDFQIGQSWVTPAQDEKGNVTDAASNTRSRLSARGFKEMAIGWYRKTITPPLSWQGLRVLLDFQGIMLVGDVFLNGQRIGGTEYGYLGFDIDISNLLHYGEENIIEVKADTGQPENSRWYTGGGLYRDVNLIITPKDYYFVRHPLQIMTQLDGRIDINAEIYWYDKAKTDSLSIGLLIVDGEGKTVASHISRLKHQRKSRICTYQLDSVIIPNPKWWSCESPYLYQAVVTLFDKNGNIADKISEQFGIRTIEYGPDFGLRLNGKKTLLKGIANHHTLGALGAAAYPAAIEKRILLMKSFGVNHIRTSHNPYSEDFLRLCDRYGILVVDELYDKWLTQFAGGRTEWTALWQHDVEEFVRRDRNHPSVVLWSLGNELQTYSNLPYNDWGVTPYRLMNTLVKRYDTTRPTTVAMHPRGRSLETDSIPAPLALETEIASYNYRYMYFPGDRRRYPNMVFYQSEANTSGIPANYFNMDLDRVIGLAHWGALDYLGESQGWPAKGWAQGLFNIALEPKPIAYHVKSYFSSEPVVHIGIVETPHDDDVWNGIQVGTDHMSENWNRQPGERLTVNVFTNADEAELYLNGNSLGRYKNPLDSHNRNKIVWQDVIFCPGRLEAVGYRNGKVIARHQLETTGETVSLLMTPDEKIWHADGQDLQHVSVKAIDRRGRQVPTANFPVTFSTSGDARIIAVSNGDITSDELPTTNHIQLFNGSALVILRAGTIPSDIVLSASNDALKPVNLHLKTK